jgi:hypothetical protein
MMLVGILAALPPLFAAPGPAAADEAAPAASDADDLKKRIAALEAELEKLRAAAAAGGTADLAELQRRIDVLAAEVQKLQIGQAAEPKPAESKFGMGPAASRVYGVTRGVSFGGYGELLYQNFNADTEDGSPSGEIDQIDLLRAILYVGYKFNDRIVLNSEIEFEHGSTEEGGSVSVEFAYIDFLLHEHANVRAGMVLVPAGFLNELHEPPTFLGAKRPEVERRIIPSTWREDGVGVLGEAGVFSYRAYILNGFESAGFTGESAFRGGRQAGAEAKAQDFGFAARVDFTGVPGLLAGGFFYQGDSSQGATAPVGFAFDPNGLPVAPPTRPFDARVRLWDLHAEYKARGLDLRALYTEGSVSDAKQVNDANGLDGTDAVGSQVAGWYAQAGYDVLSRRSGTSQSLVPFVRYESFNTQDEVASGSPQDLDPSPLVNPSPFAADPANDVDIWTYGLSWRPVFNVVIKADYQQISNEAITGVDQINFALGYLF